MILFTTFFATDVIDTGGKFTTGVVDTGGKLPLVSLTPVNFAIGINDTIGTNDKFTTGAVHTGGKFAVRYCLYRWCTLTCDNLRDNF
jgi:hypothetical protein